VYILSSIAKALRGYLAIRTASTYVQTDSPCSVEFILLVANVNVVDVLVSVSAVRMFSGSALNICFG